MAVLSDLDIEENINIGVLKIHGMNKDTIRENGLDLTISETYSVEVNKEILSLDSIIDLHNQSPDRFKKLKAQDGKIIIEPKKFMLLSTREYIEVPTDIMGFCAIRSTIARSGILSPPTILDCGFCGTLTIEIFNASERPILIHVGDRFLHVVLQYTKTPSSKPYRGEYHKQDVVREPKRSVE